MPIIPVLGRRRQQQHQEFKFILNCIESLGPVWVIWNPLSKYKNQNKRCWWSWVWWFIPMISTFGSLGQEDHCEFQAHPSYRLRYYLKRDNSKYTMGLQGCIVGNVLTSWRHVTPSTQHLSSPKPLLTSQMCNTTLSKLQTNKGYLKIKTKKLGEMAHWVKILEHNHEDLN